MSSGSPRVTAHEKCSCHIHFRDIYLLTTAAESEEDTPKRAYPGMNAITDYLVANGASLFKEPMNAQATSEEWNEYANKAIGSGANIKYTPLLSGTLPEWKLNFKPGNGGGFGRGPRPEGGNGDKPMGGRPEERPLGPGAAAAHMGTFPVAYTFTPVLEWLFGQVKRVPTDK